MEKVQNQILSALEAGVMTLQELFDRTPYHVRMVEAQVDELVQQGKVISKPFNLNGSTSQLLELSH